MASVTRYVVTHIRKDGLRGLAHAAQGRHTYATAEEAQAWIDAATRENGTRLAEFYGLPLEVRAVITRAMEQHIYDQASGEKPGPDCEYSAALRSLDQIIARLREH